MDFVNWIENLEHKLKYSQVERSKWVVETMNFLEGRARIVGSELVADNENMDYYEFKENLIKEMNNKGIRQRPKAELKKLMFKIDSDVLKFVNSSNRFIKIINPHWDKESVADAIVDLLPDHISSQLDLACQNKSISNIIYGLQCIQTRLLAGKNIASRQQGSNFQKKSFGYSPKLKRRSDSPEPENSSSDEK